MLTLTAETFSECLEIESNQNTQNSVALKFLRFGTEIFVASSNYYHSAMLASLGRKRDELDDAGYIAILTIRDSYVVRVSLDSDTLNFVPTIEQRVETIRLLAQAFLGLAEVLC